MIDYNIIALLYRYYTSYRMFFCKKILHNFHSKTEGWGDTRTISCEGGWARWTGTTTETSISTAWRPYSAPASRVWCRCQMRRRILECRGTQCASILVLTFVRVNNYQRLLDFSAPRPQCGCIIRTCYVLFVILCMAFMQGRSVGMLGVLSMHPRAAGTAAVLRMARSTPSYSNPC